MFFILSVLGLILFSSLHSNERVELIHEFVESEHPLLDQVKTSLMELPLHVRNTDLKNYQINLKKNKSKNYLVKCQHWFGINRPLAERLSKEVHSFIFWNLPAAAKKLDLTELPKEKCVLFMWDSPVVDRHLYQKKYQKFFSKIYTWDDDLIDGEKFFKFYIPALKPMISDLISFDKKKLCTLIVSNKQSKIPLELYSERKAAIEFFENLNNDEFEFYGRNWDAGTYKTYRGEAREKIEILKNFRFTLCYENIRGMRGYITEQIFDAFAAGSIPIYWGASNIEDYIPKNCFIDRRDFANHADLYAFIKKIEPEEYEKYLENIDAFLKSEQAQIFSKKNFLKTFQEALYIPK